MPERNKTLVRQSLVAYNKHDLNAVPEMMARDFVNHVHVDKKMSGDIATKRCSPNCLIPT